MLKVSESTVWRAHLPQKWPQPPAFMNVSSLNEIEACPRRWAISNAEFPNLWKERGYPSRLNPATVEGTVTHMVLEQVVRELVKGGCPSVQDAKAAEIMKSLGGYSSIINSCIDKILISAEMNPRIRPLIESLSRLLYSRAPDIRARVQAVLRRIVLPDITFTSRSVTNKQSRGPLGRGVFPEIELKANHIGWKGKADLLILSENACEIVDFKTGRHQEHHPLQLRVYALLWSRDSDLNPSGRLANKLILAYLDGNMAVEAPTAEELAKLERELVDRRISAEQSISKQPPEARPSRLTCSFCGVRQLCNDYWSIDVQRSIGAQLDQNICDIEVEVAKRHGEFSWDAVITVSDRLPQGMTAVIRTNEVCSWSKGNRLRILGATLTVDHEDKNQPAVITLGRLSECYFVS